MPTAWNVNFYCFTAAVDTDGSELLLCGANFFSTAFSLASTSAEQEVRRFPELRHNIDSSFFDGTHWKDWVFTWLEATYMWFYLWFYQTAETFHVHFFICATGTGYPMHADCWPVNQWRMKRRHSIKVSVYWKQIYQTGQQQVSWSWNSLAPLTEQWLTSQKLTLL